MGWLPSCCCLVSCLREVWRAESGAQACLVAGRFPVLSLGRWWQEQEISSLLYPSNAPPKACVSPGVWPRQ